MSIESYSFTNKTILTSTLFCAVLLLFYCYTCLPPTSDLGWLKKYVWCQSVKRRRIFSVGNSAVTKRWQGILISPVLQLLPNKHAWEKNAQYKSSIILQSELDKFYFIFFTFYLTFHFWNLQYSFGIKLCAISRFMSTSKVLSWLPMNDIQWLFLKVIVMT